MATNQESVAALEKIQTTLDQVSKMLDEIDQGLKQTGRVNEAKLSEASNKLDAVSGELIICYAKPGDNSEVLALETRRDALEARRDTHQLPPIFQKEEAVRKAMEKVQNEVRKTMESSQKDVQDLRKLTKENVRDILVNCENGVRNIQEAAQNELLRTQQRLEEALRAIYDA